MKEVDGEKTFKDIKNEVDQIMGYGKVIPILVGRDERNEPLIVNYHLTPVSLNKLGELGELLDKFMNLSESIEGTVISDEFINTGAEIIKLSISKMHPNVDIETIKNHFGLQGIGKAVKMVFGLNEFAGEMGELQAQMEKASGNLSK